MTDLLIVPGLAGGFIVLIGFEEVFFCIDLTVLFSFEAAIFNASGGQGAFLKNRPLDPQKTFY
jgi:hypothetical protein